jgi:hypothetical protein
VIFIHKARLPENPFENFTYPFFRHLPSFLLQFGSLVPRIAMESIFFNDQENLEAPMNVAFTFFADMVVFLHLGFVLFVMLGGLLVLQWKWVMWVHLPAVMWGALIEFTGWICPLTPLENWLREAGGGQGYQSDFIEHYVMPLLYPTDLTREIQIFLGVLVILLNVGIYALVFHRQKKPL